MSSLSSRPDPAPLTTVQLGFGCNNRCLVCSQGELRESEALVPARQVESALVGLQGRTVVFVGGEPTLHPQLCELIELAKRRGARAVRLQTNARCFRDPARARLAKQAGLDGVEVALFGTATAMHDYHTASPGSFRETVRGLRALLAERVAIAVNVVVTRSNYRHLAEFPRLAQALRAEVVRFSPVRAIGRAGSAPHGYSAPSALLAPRLRQATQVAQALGIAVSPVDHPDFRFAGVGRFVPPAQSSLARPVRLAVLSGAVSSEAASSRSPSFAADLAAIA